MRILMDRVVGWGLAACLATMTGVVFVSVIFRYMLNSPLSWGEELASLLFAWITFVGAYVGFRARSHIAIDTLVVFLPGWVRQGIARLVDVAVLLLLGLFVWQGVGLCLKTWSLEFPAMEISRGYLYLSLPVGASLMGVAVVEAWWERRAARRRSAADKGDRP